MKRRNFLRAVGAGAVGAGSAALIRTAMADPADAAATTRVTGSERKEWARRNFKGMENFVLPSFTPDFSDIDEEGIRHDVRHAARQGFVSTMPMSLGLSADERRRMLEFVADEARGKILVTSTLSGRTAEERVEFAKWAESLGVSQLFVSFSRSAETEDAVYETARQVIEASNLGVVLYGQPNEEFVKFDPCGLPMRALDRLADLPNVIAIKLTQVINPVTAFQVADLVHDRLLIGPVHLELAPLLASRYHVQWSGQWAVDALQSPEEPYAADFMRLLGEGSIEEALKVYWAMQPVSQAFFDLQAPLLRIGGHPWSHIKYYSWASGGNGGLLRDMGDPEHVPALDAAGRKAIQDAFASAGIGTVSLPDEAFMVGTSAFERGVRASDLVTTPQYEA